MCLSCSKVDIQKDMEKRTFTPAELIARAWVEANERMVIDGVRYNFDRPRKLLEDYLGIYEVIYDPDIINSRGSRGVFLLKPTTRDDYLYVDREEFREEYDKISRYREFR